MLGLAEGLPARQRDALLAALRIECTCERRQDRTTEVCGAHALLLDERIVKHLIFYGWPSEFWERPWSG